MTRFVDGVANNRISNQIQTRTDVRDRRTEPDARPMRRPTRFSRSIDFNSFIIGWVVGVNMIHGCTSLRPSIWAKSHPTPITNMANKQKPHRDSRSHTNQRKATQMWPACCFPTPTPFYPIKSQNLKSLSPHDPAAGLHEGVEEVGAQGADADDQVREARELLPVVRGELLPALLSVFFGVGWSVGQLIGCRFGVGTLGLVGGGGVGGRSGPCSPPAPLPLLPDPTIPSLRWKEVSK